ncbi:hypothetical protein HYH02_013627 [Chlamydomonas schloesseri]|uniref:Uncharacterized protein n=1 Tax=Chlamydomonas schloesseri TaxID=2026947 RepID=A0A835SVT5_9CHLO|nr:hypothetical protein HYH02_013627 [Chlamydomonas schloesseri]|eukprot:KAG2430788.1 hypothetical protein HYH02_013627 [Chlamydomonas schloesseri]
MHLLPFQSCLLLGVVCQELRDLVQREILRGVRSLAFDNLPGTHVGEALAWTLRPSTAPHLPHLRSLSACGSAALQPLLDAATSKAPVLAQLTALQLDCVKQLQEAQLEALLAVCPNLEVLSLPRCGRLGDGAALAVGRLLPRLRTLNCADWSSLSDAGVCGLALGCGGLEDVTLDGCLRVGSESLALLARVCPRLRRLSISKSYAVTDSALEALGAAAAAAAEAAGAYIGSSYSSSGGGGDGFGIQELVLRQCPRVCSVGLLGRCRALTSIDLSGCPRVDTAALRSMLAGCGGGLTSLQLNGCVGVGGEALVGLGAACPRLARLNLRGLTLQDCHLRDLAADCTTLQSLSLAWCTKITDTGLGPLVERNPGLQDLDMEALYTCTDDLLGRLGASCRRLGRLCIRMCHRLSPGAIVGLVEATQLSALLVSGILDEAGTLDLVARVRAARPGCTLHW